MPNVGVDQADTYKCYASNEYGRAIVTVTLNVIEGQYKTFNNCTWEFCGKQKVQMKKANQLSDLLAVSEKILFLFFQLGSRKAKQCRRHD